MSFNLNHIKNIKYEYNINPSGVVFNLKKGERGIIKQVISNNITDTFITEKRKIDARDISSKKNILRKLYGAYVDDKSFLDYVQGILGSEKSYEAFEEFKQIQFMQFQFKNKVGNFRKFLDRNAFEYQSDYAIKSITLKSKISRVIDQVYFYRDYDLLVLRDRFYSVSLFPKSREAGKSLETFTDNQIKEFAEFLKLPNEIYDKTSVMDLRNGRFVEGNDEYSIIEDHFNKDSHILIKGKWNIIRYQKSKSVIRNNHPSETYRKEGHGPEISKRNITLGEWMVVLSEIRDMQKFLRKMIGEYRQGPTPKDN